MKGMKRQGIFFTEEAEHDWVQNWGKIQENYGVFTGSKLLTLSEKKLEQ